MLFLLAACLDPLMVDLEAEIIDLSGAPLGLDEAAVGATVTGEFGYAPIGRDEAGTDAFYGLYRGQLALDLEGHAITSSIRLAIETENSTIDRLHIVDGIDASTFGIGEAQTGPMLVDGAVDETATVHLCFLDSTGQAVRDDHLPIPFAYTDPAHFRTFTLTQGGGAMALSLRWVEQR